MKHSEQLFWPHFGFRSKWAQLTAPDWMTVSGWSHDQAPQLPGSVRTWQPQRAVDFPVSNMFYNLRRSSPKAYAIMHKKGLISLPPMRKVEDPGNDSPHSDTGQNAADWDNGSQQSTGRRAGLRVGVRGGAPLDCGRATQTSTAGTKSSDAREGMAGARTGGDEGPNSDTAELTQTEIGEDQGRFPEQARERQQQGQGRSISPEGYEEWHPHNWPVTTTNHLPPNLANYLGHQRVSVFV